ncbi:Phosphoglucosamine mutase, partial [Haemophilus influenzae]
MYWKKW